MFCDMTLRRVRSKQVSNTQLVFSRESAGDLNRLLYRARTAEGARPPVSILATTVDRSGPRVTDARPKKLDSRFDVTGEICTKWNERESTWRKSCSGSADAMRNIASSVTDEP